MHMPRGDRPRHVFRLIVLFQISGSHMLTRGASTQLGRITGGRNSVCDLYS